MVHSSDQCGGGGPAQRVEVRTRTDLPVTQRLREELGFLPGGGGVHAPARDPEEDVAVVLQLRHREFPHLVVAHRACRNKCTLTQRKGRGARLTAVLST